MTEHGRQKELERVRRGRQPDALKAQAQERVKRRVAKWRLRPFRIYLKRLLSDRGRPLLTSVAIGASVLAFWGDALGFELVDVDSEAED